MHKYFAIGSLPGTFVLSGLLTLLAFLMLFTRRSGGVLRALAMLISFAGDLINSNFRGLTASWRFPPLFVGAAVFAVAHMLYMLSFLRRNKKEGKPGWNAGGYIGLGLVAAAAAGLGVMFFTNPARSAAMGVMGFVYLAAIGSNMVAACIWAWNKKGWAIVAVIGAVCFCLSDYILAFGPIGGNFDPRPQQLVWWFYPIGQLLLILG